MTTDLIHIHTHARLGDARGNAPFRLCSVNQRTIAPDLSAYVNGLVRTALKAEGYHWCAKCAGWHK